MTRVTRRYRFAAAHRLESAALTAKENRSVYGKCNNPYGHGHDYTLEVSVAGAPHPGTGRVIAPGSLDALVRCEALARLDAVSLNDLPEFAAEPATTENLALAIERWLAARWPEGWPPLCRIRIEETRRNHFELRR